MASRTFSRPRMDAVLHRERLAGGKKRLHALPMPLEKLPDGAMVQAGTESYLIAQGRALQWSPARLSARAASRCHAADAAFDAARVGAGYRPVLHPSAARLR